MKPLLLALLIFFIGSGCSEDKMTGTEEAQEALAACGINDPIQELDWLKSMVEDTEQSSTSEYAYVELGKYKGETVFILNNCCPFCDFAIPVLNCKGETVCYLGGCDNFERDFYLEAVIWKGNGFECILN